MIFKLYYMCKLNYSTLILYSINNLKDEDNL